MRFHPHHSLGFVVLTGLRPWHWVLSAVNGYAWQMLWFPAAIAVAAWPTRRRRNRHRNSCR
jgi:hypothetical protein